MSNEFKTDTDTDGNGFHGGMESDDVDSTADFHRKRFKLSIVSVLEKNLKTETFTDY